MISYRPATWPFDLRDSLIRAGCNEQVASVIAKGFGEIVDHIAEQQKSLSYDAKMESFAVRDAKSDIYGKIALTGIIILVIALVTGVLIALLK